MDITYTHGNIHKAVVHLATADEPMPQRAWDAYQVVTRGSSREGFEAAFQELDVIFKAWAHDEVATRLSLEDARRGAAILLRMHDSLVERSATPATSLP